MKGDVKFLVLFTGPPATGKTTVANTLEDMVGREGGIVHLQSDEIRHMIASPTYSRRESSAVYDALLSLTRTFLRYGYSVIADATFAKARHRAPFKAVAGRFGARLLMVYFRCSIDTALRRNSERTGWRFVPPQRLAAIYRSFEYEPSLVAIDTETLNAEQAAQKILGLLDAGLEMRSTHE